MAALRAGLMRGESWPRTRHGERHHSPAACSHHSSPQLVYSPDTDILTDSAEPPRGRVIGAGGPSGLPWEHPLTAAEKRARLLFLYDKEEKQSERDLRRARRESASLRSQSARLKAEASALLNDTERLSRDRTALCSENSDLRGQNVQLRDQLERLREKLQRHRRRTVSSAPGVLSPSGLVPTDALKAQTLKSPPSPPSTCTSSIGLEQQALPQMPRTDESTPLHPAAQAQLEAMAAQVVESEERVIAAERKRAAAVKLYVTSAEQIGRLRAKLASNDEQLNMAQLQMGDAQLRASLAEAKVIELHGEIDRLNSVITEKDEHLGSCIAQFASLQAEMSCMLRQQANLRRKSIQSVASLLQASGSASGATASDLSVHPDATRQELRPEEAAPQVVLEQSDCCISSIEGVPSPPLWTPPQDVVDAPGLAATAPQMSTVAAAAESTLSEHSGRERTPAENRRSCSSAETCICSDESSSLSAQVLRVLDFQLCG
mmetsp:Transcript_51383/g.94994  ORF Transcript_51383/g.94994 Transcript_51383/m.94994 type:complete len:490 (-) Transcript_51383:223-1692(-)